MEKFTAACPPPKIAHCTIDYTKPFDPAIPNSNVTCVCLDPAPPKPPVARCTYTLQYEPTSPAQATVGLVEGSGCDSAGLELALAVLLAKMLGAP